MFDSVSEVLVTLGPVALGAMGVIVSLIPNLARRSERWFWIAGFALVGSAVSLASYYETHSGNVMEREIWESETGGDNFCYFDMIPSPDPTKVKLVIKNPGNVPIYDLRATFIETRTAAGLFDFSHWKPSTTLIIDTVHPGSTELTTLLSGQGYAIGMKARNGRLLEVISHVPDGSNFTDKLLVFRIVQTTRYGNLAVQIAEDSTGLPKPTYPQPPPIVFPVGN